MQAKALLTSTLLGVVAVSQAQQAQIPLEASKPSTIPLLGYGTWNLDSSNVSESVSIALQTGYKHLDCAAAYGNQKDVGKGIAHGLKKTGLGRSDIWVTSKLWNDHHGADKVEEGLDTTLSNLGLEYLDLFLMHWPVTSVDGNAIEYLETWHAMEKLLDTGKVRHIGVSNLDPAQMKDLIRNSNTKPAVHQFELHPYLQQTKWVQWHKDNGINVTAYSPFGNINPIYGAPGDNDDAPPLLLENKAVEDIALVRGCTSAQVVLAWGMHRRTGVIPKSSHADRIKENFATTECQLQEVDYEQITDLAKKYIKRFNNPSEDWDVPLYEGLEDA